MSSPIIFASAQRTADHDSAEFETSSGRISLVWDITAINGAPPTLVLVLMVEDPVDGAWKVFHSFTTTRNTTGVAAYHSGCGEGTGNQIAPLLPRAKFKVKIVHSNANGATYSLSKIER